MYRIGILGLGRIGAMHSEIIAAQPNAAVSWCCDTDLSRAQAAARKTGGRATSDISEVLASDDVDAVLIASPTNTHVELILRAAETGKPIFCEKPIDLDIRKVEACRDQLESRDVLLQMGFNRRFDPGHRSVRDAVAAGEIGPLELLSITSRDPGPPPPRPILEACGGLFRDTTIHDFDMARFVMGEDPVEVFAMAACRVDPVFAELNDVDTAMIVMRSESGALCHINNSRRTNYGYDQRIEAFGKDGLVRSNNLRPTEVSRYSSAGTRRGDQLLHFFIERYKTAYEKQFQAFLDAVASGRPPEVTYEDGRKALILAEAAIASFKGNRPTAVKYD